LGSEAIGAGQVLAPMAHPQAEKGPAPGLILRR